MSKPRNWAIIAVVAVAAVFAAGWYFAIAPQKSRVTQLHSQTSAQQQANTKLKGQLAVLRQREQQVPAEQASIAAVQKRIPSDVGLPAYIRALTADAAAAHVELVSVAPAQPALVKLATPAPKAPAPSAAGVTPAQSPGATPGAAAPPLSVITVTIDVVGDYFAVQQFLSKLEHESRITVVSGIDLKPGALPKPESPAGASSSAAPNAAPAGPDWHTLQASITAAVFMTSESAPAASAAGQTPPSGAALPSPAPSASASH